MMGRLVMMLGVLALAQSAPAQVPALDVLQVPGTPALLTAQVGWHVAAVPRARLTWQLLMFLYADLHGRPNERQRLRDAVDFLWDVTDCIDRLRLAQPLAIDPKDEARRRPWLHLLDTVGFDLSFSKSSSMAIVPRHGSEAAQRRDLLQLAGVDLTGAVQILQAGGPVQFKVPVFEVPLPLGLDFWATNVLHRKLTPRDLLDVLLEDDHLAFFYMGLTALDPATQGVVAAEPAILHSAMENPEIFAQFARSIRVVDGSVVCPLSPDADSLWAGLVGASPHVPRDFIPRLLGKDDGRAAWLFDTVVHLSSPLQRYVFGTWLPEASRRREFSHFYESFTGNGGEDLIRKPFSSSFDPAALLAQVIVHDDGQPGEPTSRRFIEAALDTVDVNNRVDVAWRAPRSEDVLTAGALIDIVFAGPRRNAARRTLGYSYAQRLLARSADASPIDLASALRGRELFPALLIGLERIPIAKASIIALAVTRAESFRRSARADAVQIGLLQYQSCLSLVISAVLSGALSVEQAAILITDLSVIEPGKDDDMYHGRVAQWLSESLVPELNRQVDSRGSAEETLLLALSGRLKGAAPAVPVQYAGLDYTFDPVGPTWQRMSLIREKQQRPSLDLVVRFSELSRQLASAGSVEQLQQWTTEIKQIGEGLASAVPPGAGSPWLDAWQTFGQVVRLLGEIHSPRDIAHVDRYIPDLQTYGDWTTAYIVLSWAYAASLGDSSGLLLGGGDVSSRHDLGLLHRPRMATGQVPWDSPQVLVGTELIYDCGGGSGWSVCVGVPQDNGDVKWHVEGSVLGLDLTLGGRLEAESPTSDLGAGVLSRADRASFVASTLMLAAASVSPRTPVEVAEVIETGRRTFSDPLARSHTGPEWRAANVPWALAHEPEALPDLVTLVDLFRLGLRSAVHTESFDLWGANALSFDGCPFLEMRVRTDLDGRSRYSDYLDLGYLGELAVELHLHLAGLMASASIPVELEPILYGLAVQDLLPRGSQMCDSADWESLATAARSLTPDRLQDFLGLLTRREYLKPAAPGR
jgi:hypothetical protein